MPHERIPFEAGFHIDPDRSGPSWLVDPDGLVYLRCRCGLILGALTNHSIDADGTVNASVLHDASDRRNKVSCDWHTFVQLGDWTDGAMGAGSHKFAVSKVAA